VPGSGTPVDCTSTFTLVPGASCNLSIVFAPQQGGLIKGVATFTDNALNKIPYGAPQSITIQNIGNQPLNAIAPGLIVGTDFLLVAGSGTPADCTSTFTLTPGASCNLSIVFAPHAVGTIKGTATFTDNALNKIPSASQSVKLKGIGIQKVVPSTNGCCNMDGGDETLAEKTLR
jgi:hypothetical protein